MRKKYLIDQRISVCIISEIDPGISKSIQVLRHADYRSEGNERKTIPYMLHNITQLINHLTTIFQNKYFSRIN